MPGDYYRFVWTFHHILIDGRSFGLLIQEALAIYAALEAGKAPQLLPAVPFQDFVRWQAQLDHSKSMPFWQDLLSGFQTPTILKLPGSAPGHSDSGFGVASKHLSADLTTRLREFASQNEVGVSTLLQAAWALLAARYSGSKDVVYGVTRACRGGPGRDSGAAPGIYINTLPARFSVDPSTPVTEFLSAIRAQQKAVAEHEHTPLVDVQRCSELPAGQSLLDSIVVYDQASLNAELRSLGNEWAEREFELRERPSFPLALYAYGDEELFLRLTYEQTRADQVSAAALLDSLETALISMSEAPDRLIGDVDYVPAAEVERLREIGLGAAVSIPQQGVHELVATHATTKPGEVAVIAADEQLTWAELDRRANLLAAHLVELGAGPGKIVGICTDRSVDLAIGLLGIFKSGAAYLPLDPDFPADRLKFMIADSATEVIVTQSWLKRQLDADASHAVLLDHLDMIAGDAPVAIAPTPGQLAYLIYTSGSTGTPKGSILTRSGPGWLLPACHLIFPCSRFCGR
jgi:non-ribosomal peptide synthetase component F